MPERKSRADPSRFDVTEPMIPARQVDFGFEPRKPAGAPNGLTDRLATARKLLV